MNKYFHLVVLLTSITLLQPAFAQDRNANRTPLKILLVAGGCCHDYAAQTKILKEGIESRINAVVTVEFNPSTTTDTTFEIYKSDDWANGYDVVIHDECSAKVMDEEYVGRILNAHKGGVPAINLHCAMHSYRWGEYQQPVELTADNAGWYEMLGVQSTRHGPKTPIDVSFSKSDSAITKGLEDWTTVNEELYNNIRVFDGTTALASGKQLQPPRKNDLKKNPDLKAKEATAVVVWTNEYGPKKTKIFSTTLGHMNETVADERYLELVTRGTLWVTGNLTSAGKPTAAYAK